MRVNKQFFYEAKGSLDIYKKILVADDNPAMRQTLRMFIGKICDRIYECSDGGEAFELYHEHNPEWVLMDLDMKPVDGLTATKRIIARDPWAKICIVTGFNETELRSASLRAGASDYVIKDDLSRLKKVLADC